MRCLLLQAFVGNAASCRKVQAGRVEKIIELLCEFKHEVPEYIDVLYAMLKVAGTDTPLRRNQALVMKYIMRSFAQIGADFSADRDVRYTTMFYLGISCRGTYPPPPKRQFPPQNAPNQRIISKITVSWQSARRRLSHKPGGKLPLLSIRPAIHISRKIWAQKSHGSYMSGLLIAH